MYIRLKGRAYKVFKEDNNYYVMKRKNYKKKVNRNHVYYGSPSTKSRGTPIKTNLSRLLKQDKKLRGKIKELKSMVKYCNTSVNLMSNDDCQTTLKLKILDQFFFYDLFPWSAIGFGLFVGFGSPVNGCSKLFDALRGYEKVDVTIQPVSTADNPSPTPLPSVYENTSLDFSQRWGKVKEGTFYIVGAPLIGATFFFLSLRSFNNPGGGF